MKVISNHHKFDENLRYKFILLKTVPAVIFGTGGR